MTVDGSAPPNLHLLPSTPLQFLAYALTATILWITCWGIYHAYLHPLSHIPGPKLWAAYRVPYVYYNVTGQLPFKVTALHAKYGPVVRIAPDQVAFTDAEAWNDIQGLQPGRIQNQKDVFAYSPHQPGWEEGIIMADDAVHARLRRMYGVAFTPKALEEQAGMLKKYADLLITQLKLKVKESGVVDLSAWCMCGYLGRGRSAG